MQTTRDVTPKLSHPRCPYCHESVSPAEDKEPCRACMAWHHSACYGEHGRCAACGRSPAPSLASSPSPGPQPPQRSVARALGRRVKRTFDDVSAWSVVALLVSLLVAVVLGAVIVVFKTAFGR